MSFSQFFIKKHEDSSCRPENTLRVDGARPREARRDRQGAVRQSPVRRRALAAHGVLRQMGRHTDQVRFIFLIILIYLI